MFRVHFTTESMGIKQDLIDVRFIGGTYHMFFAYCLGLCKGISHKILEFSLMLPSGELT